MTEFEPRYSGPNRSGICVCGCRWDKHHLGMVAKQEYVDQTGEVYIAQECESFGFNEVGGMAFDEETQTWEVHCFGYLDTLHPDARKYAK